MEDTYQHIPQYQYLIDGLPAKTCGEWPGIKPNHWKGSLRVIHPYQTQKIFDRDEYIPILSRRHFSERRGTELTVRPAKKLFIDKKYQENIEDKPCGLRRVNLNNTITKIQYDKKHFAQRFGIENDPEILHIKTFHPDGNCLSMIETPIEKEFGIKKKLWSLTERRNGMELRIPGDKYYKASEHLSDFFKEGGLIPGSSNKINFNKTQSKRSNNFYDTLNIRIRTLDRTKIWNNKIKKETLDNDTLYVKTLNDWEKNILVDYDKPKEKEIKGKTKKEPQSKKENKAKPVPKGKKK